MAYLLGQIAWHNPTNDGVILSKRGKGTELAYSRRSDSVLGSALINSSRCHSLSTWTRLHHKVHLHHLSCTLKEFELSFDLQRPPQMRKHCDRNMLSLFAHTHTQHYFVGKTFSVSKKQKTFLNCFGTDVLFFATNSLHMQRRRHCCRNVQRFLVCGGP